MKFSLHSPRTTAGALSVAVFCGGGCGGPSKPPETGSWKPMAAGPSIAAQALAVWTGKEMLAWGGPPQGNCGSIPPGHTACDIGGRYDPAADQWKAMGPAPVAGRVNTPVIWTGSEMVVWSGLWAGG